MTADLREDDYSRLADAIEAVGEYTNITAHRLACDKAASILRALPTAPAPEPVAWRCLIGGHWVYGMWSDNVDYRDQPGTEPLYASPPHQTESESGATDCDDDLRANFTDRDR